jgi:hypothetical protein
MSTANRQIQRSAATRQALLRVARRMFAKFGYGGTAAPQPDPWRALIAGTNSFLSACLDPAVQQIVLVDGPAVLGLERWRETDQSYYLASVKLLLEASIAQGLIDKQPVAPLAHVIFGALNEAALVIARAEDKEAARREVSDVVRRLFEGLQGKPRSQTPD